MLQNQFNASHARAPANATVQFARSVIRICRVETLCLSEVHRYERVTSDPQYINKDYTSNEYRAS